MEGKVKWFNEQKGYGFITRTDGQGDVFVHFSGISGEGFRNLKENDRVSFDIEATDKGDRAVRVRVGAIA